MVASAPAAAVAAGGAAPAALRVIDVDLHHQIANWQEVAPYAPDGLRHRIARPGGPPLARHGFKIIGPRFGDAPRATDAQGKPGHPAGDPAWVKAEYLDKRGIDLAILTGSVLSLGVQPNQDMAAAIATGVNNWTLEKWVRPTPASRARSSSRTRTPRRRSRRSTASATIRGWSRC